jgi:anti-sigma regulatory factor (Ser/Thr protein kinase)
VEAATHPRPARQGGPRFTPAPPPVPRDPAAQDHNWPDRWPLRTYLELAPLDTAPRTARAHAADVLRKWDLQHIYEETALVISELMTNAVNSTRTHQPCAPVRLWMLGSPATAALILIWDATAPPPAPRPAAPDAEDGRGLAIVTALARQWGSYRPLEPPSGKVTWAIMTPQPPAYLP